MHLISYDIQEDGLRVKMAKILIKRGLYRVQYSVFMGEIKDSTVTKIKQSIDELMQRKEWTAEDTVMILPLHQYSEDYVEFFGKFPGNWDEITGELHTLLL